MFERNLIAADIPSRENNLDLWHSAAQLIECQHTELEITSRGNRARIEKDSLFVDEQAGGKGEHETPRTHLDLFGTVLRDESSQCRVSNVVGSVEYSVQQSICDQEPCVLCKLSQIGRDGENCYQRNGTPLGMRSPSRLRGVLSG